MEDCFEKPLRDMVIKCKGLVLSKHYVNREHILLPASPACIVGKHLIGLLRSVASRTTQIIVSVSLRRSCKHVNLTTTPCGLSCFSTL